MRRERTPSQTVGPFFSIGLCARPDNEVVAPGTPGAVRIEGRVLDGAGDPVPDSMLEIWPEWGRCGTDDAGRYSFVTRPPAPGPGEEPVLTRVYFPGEPANDQDPVLLGIPDADERSTLVAVADGDVLRFDVRLQGERQTAFFSL